MLVIQRADLNQISKHSLGLAMTMTDRNESSFHIIAFVTKTDDSVSIWPTRNLEIISVTFFHLFIFSSGNRRNHCRKNMSNNVQSSYQQKLNFELFLPVVDKKI